MRTEESGRMGKGRGQVRGRGAVLKEKARGKSGECLLTIASHSVSDYAAVKILGSEQTQGEAQEAT